MNLKNKFAVITGSAILVGSLLAGAAFAATDSTTAATRAQAMAERLDQAVTDGKITQAAADVLKQISELRVAAMEKLQADSQALVDQAVKDGKVTQEEADTLLKNGGRGGFKGGGMGFRGMTQEELKAHLDAEVAAGRLTQEQADQLLSGQGKFGGKRGGFGRGGFMLQPQQSQQSQSN